jgi:hypothetical protein
MVNFVLRQTTDNLGMPTGPYARPGAGGKRDLSDRVRHPAADCCCRAINSTARTNRFDRQRNPGDRQVRGDQAGQTLRGFSPRRPEMRPRSTARPTWFAARGIITDL